LFLLERYPHPYIQTGKDLHGIIMGKEFVGKVRAKKAQGTSDCCPGKDICWVVVSTYHA
jgi:hypothetical protein